MVSVLGGKLEEDGVKISSQVKTYQNLSRFHMYYSHQLSILYNIVMDSHGKC